MFRPMWARVLAPVYALAEGYFVGVVSKFYEGQQNGIVLQAVGATLATFLVMLFLTSLSGLALLVLRHTPAMGTMLALHLGLVFGLFLTMPYGKFVHGLYRYAALVRYALERAH